MSDVAFGGERFTVADKIGLMPLMRFAKAAQGGVDSNDMAGLAAMYDLIEQCIAPADWARFQSVADKTRADGEELMAVVKDVIEALSARPTTRPSDSSAGPATIEPKSAAEPDLSDQPELRLIRSLESQGRPDKAQFVKLAMQGRSVG